MSFFFGKSKGKAKASSRSRKPSLSRDPLGLRQSSKVGKVVALPESSLSDFEWSSSSDDEDGWKSAFYKECKTINETNILESETPIAFVYTLDVQNVKPEETNVKILHGKVLYITVMQESRGKDSSAESALTRVFMLRGNQKINEKSVKIGNGVITVTIPKKQEEIMGNIMKEENV